MAGGEKMGMARPGLRMPVNGSVKSQDLADVLAAAAAGVGVEGGALAGGRRGIDSASHAGVALTECVVGWEVRGVTERFRAVCGLFCQEVRPEPLGLSHKAGSIPPPSHSYLLGSSSGRYCNR